METLQGGENIDIQDSTRRTEPDAISQPVESSLSIFSEAQRGVSDEGYAENCC